MHKLFKNNFLSLKFKSKLNQQETKFKNILPQTKYQNKFQTFQKKDYFKKTNILLHNRSYMYEILGVEKDCTNEEIKKAYINLARQYHPEINKDAGAEEMFKSLTNAYEALSNKRNRDLYNAYMELDLYDPDWLIENEREKAEKDKDEYSKFYSEQRKNANNSYDYNFSDDFENVFTSGFKESKKQKAEDINVKFF